MLTVSPRVLGWVGVLLTTGELWPPALLPPFDSDDIVHPFICSILIIDDIMWVCSSFFFRHRTPSIEAVVEET